MQLLEFNEGKTGSSLDFVEFKLLQKNLIFVAQVSSYKEWKVYKIDSNNRETTIIFNSMRKTAAVLVAYDRAIEEALR